jgi:putative ABC transport system permease protein
MNLWNTITTGFREILAHKFRSLLTMLGIILGVSSLVAMSAMVKGMENGLKESLEEAGGLRNIRIEYEDDLPLYQRHLFDQATGVTMHDVYALKESAPLAKRITPLIEIWGFRRGALARFGGKRTRPFKFAGTWPDILSIEQHEIAHGRMFNEVDDEEARSVCVIGTEIRDDLFGSPEKLGREEIPIGKTIVVNSQPLTIIGMFDHYQSESFRKKKDALEKENLALEAAGKERKKGNLRDDLIFRLKNKSIYIPLNTMLLKFRTDVNARAGADARLTTLVMEIDDVQQLDAALQQARNVLMFTHKGIEDFAFRTREDDAGEITKSIAEARSSGGLIAAISLLVGGIGIMNIMLASISERVREIGLRKAVGATTADVFVQILVESTVIAILGGLLGLFASIGLIDILRSVTPESNDPVVSFAPMAIAFSCSVSVGVLAGLFPAIKASRLHPIQALRFG